MFLRIMAVLFGIGFIFVGVAGYLPTFMRDGMLFGYFMVDSMHNIVHIVTGVIAIMAATRYKCARFFFQLFGVLYIATAVCGYWQSGDLYMFRVNLPDNLFHFVVGIVFLLLGFSKKKVEV
ncbi:MAG: hypothetical protein A3F14_00135 [Gammaproteobacteria bacterium RIFCSPHIGHO2_12_FULL_43_28]|nr:MAG: hypothetical protein A3F14_00135 [Gammaproteobacteria bacterium RIFCSPHIGHO2_12_FULL_43_28]